MNDEQDLLLENVSKNFHNFSLSNINLRIKKGEIVSIIGESGSGKSTLVKIISGIIKQDEGNIYLGLKCINDVSTEKRNFRMVWQDYLLFPNMTVRENLEFGLKVNNYDKKEIKKIVADVSTILNLNSKLDLPISNLSGGEKQRVAIGRSIVLQPEILILDEPFSSLDSQTSNQLQNEIIKLKEKYGFTIIIVTHQINNALLISNKIMVLKNGTIQQIGSAQEIFSSPKNKYVAEFVGKTNLVKGKVIDTSKDNIVMMTDIGKIKAKKTSKYIKKNQSGMVIINPEKIYITREINKIINNSFLANFKNEKLSGSMIYQYFELNNKQMFMVERHISSNPERFNENEKVLLYFKEIDIKVIYHLNVLAWVGYHEESIVKSFEEKFNISVEVDTFFNADQMIKIFEKKKEYYDVIIVDYEYLDLLIKKNLLQPVSKSINIKNVFDYFLNLKIKNHDKYYALPIRYGDNSLVYNSKYFSKNEIKSYNVLLNKISEKKIGIWDWYLPNLYWICTINNIPYLNNLSEKEKINIGNFLKRIKPLCKFYSTPEEIRDAFKSEEIIIAPGVGLYLTASKLKEENYPIEYSIPIEGGLLWLELACVSKYSKNVDMANHFIQHLLSPKTQVELIAREAYRSGLVNIKALEIMKKSKKTILNLENSKQINSFVSSLTPRKLPKDIKKWNDLWDSFSKN